MTVLATLDSRSLAGGAALTGSWQLPAGHAITLRPARTGRLRITGGRAWATLDGPHGRREGDLVLDAGERLCVQAGQRVVIEPWGRQVAAPLCFSFEPEAVPA